MTVPTAKEPRTNSTTDDHEADASNEQFIGADYRKYLESGREEEWVLLHERQTWGAWHNDATGHSYGG